jgi:GT2 family glycosyltransferase
MKASIIIPVWNGASVVEDCLTAVFDQSGPDLFEVICVDNASGDDSAARIERAFPQVRLIHQLVNLGFAGGVNAGMEAARGDFFVLLNQDCIVQAGWLHELVAVLQAQPRYGIAGSTIYNADGTLNHTGAVVRRPDAVGLHLTETGNTAVKSVDFLTGAAFALPRQTWDLVGRFDEGFYPGYYEDSDYCYRARHKGLESAWVPASHVRHLFSSKEWQADPIKNTTTGYLSRYRFICKHFNETELTSFFEAEGDALENTAYLDHLLGRVIAARHTLRNLPEILDRRLKDLGEDRSAADQRLLMVGFSKLIRQALQTAQKIIKDRPQPQQAAAAEPALSAAERDFQIQALRQRQEDLLTGILYRSPYNSGEENRLQRLKRLVFKQLPGLLSGREYAMLLELSRVHLRLLETLEYRGDYLQQQIEQLVQINHQQASLIDQLYHELDQRVELMEILAKYDNR